MTWERRTLGMREPKELYKDRTVEKKQSKDNAEEGGKL